MIINAVLFTLDFNDSNTLLTLNNFKRDGSVTNFATIKLPSNADV